MDERQLHEMLVDVESRLQRPTTRSLEGAKLRRIARQRIRRRRAIVGSLATCVLLLGARFWIWQTANEPAATFHERMITASDPENQRQQLTAIESQIEARLAVLSEVRSSQLTAESSALLQQLAQEKTPWSAVEHELDRTAHYVSFHGKQMAMSHNSAAGEAELRYVIEHFPSSVWAERARAKLQILNNSETAQ